MTRAIKTMRCTLTPNVGDTCNELYTGCTYYDDDDDDDAWYPRSMDL